MNVTFWKRVAAEATRLWEGALFKFHPRMITCREFDSFVVDYLDDKLPIAQRRKFELHLKTCESCRDYLTAYEKTVEIGQALLISESDNPPADAPEDLVKAILDARRSAQGSN